MNLQVNQNHKGYQTLLRYSQNRGITIRDLLMADEHLDAVCDILYKEMSGAIKLIVKKDKFKTMFLNQRESLVEIFENASAKDTAKDSVKK